MNKDNKSLVDLLSTTDADKWASEFIRIKEENNWTLEDIDKELMISWFANAMYTQKIECRKEREDA